jgi:PhzF family phenazine biosynthesis protein
MFNSHKRHQSEWAAGYSLTTGIWQRRRIRHVVARTYTGVRNDRVTLAMAIELFHIDAFTDRPFAGNPAAVCLIDGELDSSWAQHVAAEMNLSETAFVSPAAGELARSAVNGFNLRWFTPKAEVELCGHATLASAHVLWEAGRLAHDTASVFHTRSGALTCTRDSAGLISMDFPARIATPCEPPAGLIDALRASAVFVGNNRMDYLIHVPSEKSLRALDPDFRALKSVKARGVIVTAASTSGEYDFVSRFFAPAVGVDEDPVTGSAHCCLAPYWAEHFGRHELIGYQASPRGGTVRVRVAGQRVILIGQAVTVMRGELFAAPTVARS